MSARPNSSRTASPSATSPCGRRRRAAGSSSRAAPSACRRRPRPSVRPRPPPAHRRRRGHCEGPRAAVKSLPNIITLARLLLVPAIIWSLSEEDYLWAFILFVVAGASDALDGFLAKKLNAHTRLGAYLDPLADKALLVSI